MNEIIDGVKVNNLVLHNASSAAGDSGGPYFGPNAKSEIMIEGTHVAQGNFQPIATSLKEMGLELLTVNNETRP